MKLSFFSLLMIASYVLYGQQTIELGQDVMGTFSSDSIECYELTIDEAGEYILSYNLLDATVTILTPGGQELFSDYMNFFAPTPNEKQITLQNTGTYQLCFSRGGTTSMYQCRIDKKDSTGSDEAIPLQYGEYLLTETITDNTATTYSFNGQENEKIQIGIGGAFAANLIIASPSETILYNQSFEIPPNDGLKLEFDLEEAGEYFIKITPLVSFLQYSISLYLLEPIKASFVQFNTNNPYGGVLVNFGVDYYQFYAYAGDTVQLNYTGSTAGITMQVITPGNETVNCNDTIDEIHLVHTLNIEEDGTHVVVINSDLQGISVYSLSVEIAPEPYELGTLIIKEIAHLYKKVYSFNASQNDILRIGLDLPSKVVELKAPNGTIILSLNDTASTNIKTDIFKEITLDDTGEYIISLWHDFTGYSPVIMKFCASIVPQPVMIKKDSVYNISVPPYQRFPYAFDANIGNVVRLGFPFASIMLTPVGDSVTVNTGTSYVVQQNGTYTISHANYLTDSSKVEVWVNTVVPTDSATSVEIGEAFFKHIEMYETPSIVYNGILGDTVFVQGEITELILSPNATNIKNTPSWLYISTPSGELIRVEGKPLGRICEDGYIITYSFKKKFILDSDGEYFMTACIDKDASINLTNVTLRIDKEGEQMEVPFGTDFDYELPGIYACSVPDGLDQLFVIVKKSICLGWYSSWQGSVSLEQGDQTWQSLYSDIYFDRREDFIFYVEQPDPGLYLLPVFAKVFDEEIRGSILFTDQLPEMQINKWSSGVITRPYGSDWKMIEIDQQVDTLYFETEGFGLYSTLDVIYNNINNTEEKWVFQNWCQGYHIEGKIPNAQVGRYYIRYVDSAVLQDHDKGFGNQSEDQTRIYMLYVGAAWSENSGLSTIRDVSSHVLGAGEASLTIFGSGFSSVTGVNLLSEDEQNIISMNIQGVINNGRELIAGYDFSGVEPGTYYLEIESSDTLIRYNKKIEITPLVTTSINSSMLTSDLYRLGRNQKCIISITNNGTTDIPYAAGYFYTTSDQVCTLVTNTPESDYEVDSINALLQEKGINQIPFFIENLRVGEEAEFIYKIYSSTFPVNETFKVGYLLGILSESDYYSLQDPMATDWYQFLISCDIIPNSMKSYLEGLSLNEFIDIWNSAGDNVLKSTNGSIDATDIENGINYFYKALDKLPGKLPFIIPYKIVRKGVDVVWKKTKECCNRLQEIQDLLDNLNNQTWDQWDEEVIYKEAVSSTTPEDKYGPVGYGTESGKGYIDSLDLFEYRIDYWNKEDATAPAAIVYIRDTIDTDFDLKTLKLTEVGFLKWKMKLDGGQYFNINVDCRPDMPYIVNIEGTVDYENREVYWVHTTLDPETMELPDDPMSGYLPPIDSTGYQMGWVNYTIRPEGELMNGVSFENQAFVNFDGVGPWGPAPPYGPYTSIFDFVLPWSYIEALAPVQTELAFDIHLHGTDQGSGVDHFDIYVSKDDDEIYLWKTTGDTVVAFSGEDGADYKFYSISTDLVGNSEPIKSVFDTYTFIDLGYTGIHKNTSNKMPGFYCYPNPVSSTGIIFYELNKRANLKIDLYDLSGREIKTLLNTSQEAGSLYLPWSASSLANGMYIIKLQVEDTDIGSIRVVVNK